MPNFQNGKVYTIRSHQTEELYIGSTCQTLPERFRDHKRDFRRYQNGKGRYVTSFKILAYGDAYYELYENCPCNDKNELTRREGEIIRATPNCVNKHIPGRTDKEWRQANAETIKDYKKEYYQNNTETYKAKNKQYRQANADKIKQKHDCPCGGKYTTSGKSTHLKTKKHQKYLETV